VFCSNRPDFFIRLQGKITNISNIIFLYDNVAVTNIHNVVLYFPFENAHSELNLNPSSAIISTFCKNYSHRLDEWIQYNLKLGFSAIIIFNNDSNTTGKINESLQNAVQLYSVEQICNKYKGKVLCINFPYSTIHHHYDNIQRTALHIGVNAFKNITRNIALIDADEFIYLPNKNITNITNIQDFLQNYNTIITIQSNTLTNKNNNDIINNNILQIAKYIGNNNYTKLVLYNNNIKDDEFIVTPHEHDDQQILDKNIIIYYHCWVNDRCQYNESMQLFDINN
jgi:hypothetical protein